MKKLMVGQFGFENVEGEDGVAQAYLTLEGDVEEYIDEKALEKLKNAIIEFCDKIVQNVQK